MVANELRQIGFTRRSVPVPAKTILVLVGTYWLSLILFGQGQFLQFLLGSVLLFVLPGYLLLQVLRISEHRPGVVSLLVVGSSAVTVLLSIVVIGTVLPGQWATGLLSVPPLAATLTVLVVGLLAVLTYRDGTSATLVMDVPTGVARHAVVLLLPLVGVLAAAGMRLYGTSAGSYLFVGAVAVCVLLVRAWPTGTSLYPSTVYSVTLGLVLHRNLTSPHVVGADIQGAFAASHHVFTTQFWSPALSGAAASVPGVTVLPAAVARLLGTPFAPSFKLTLVFLFSFVPLAIYYLAEEVFDAEAALYGAAFFAFYHLSIGLTPGKQLVAELFAVLLLATLGFRTIRRRQPVLVGLFSAGLILTHYGVTIVVGLGLLVAACVSVTLERVREDYERGLSVAFPVGFLTVAFAWYAVASPPLVARIGSIPGRLVRQLGIVFGGGSIEQSGMNYAASGTSLLQLANFLVYGVLAGLAGIGIVALAYRGLSGPVTDRRRRWLEFAAIAAPVFALLGASYFLVLDLWADRVYQLALTVLAPLVPVGYWFATTRGTRIRPASSASLRSIGLTALLVAVLLMSTGLAYAAAGDAGDSRFDEEANDLSFDDGDLAAIAWLHENAGVERTSVAVPTTEPGLTVDYPGRVQLYTDTTTFQLLRSTASSRYYTTELVTLKNPWRPSVDTVRVESGYVILRSEAITAEARGDPPSAGQLTPEEADRLRDLGPIVYDRAGVQIVRVGGEDDSAITEAS